MILQQWIDEFDRHIEGGTPVNVCCYQGIRSGEYTRASTLAGYDVVVTSYQVLQSELDHANIQTEGKHVFFLMQNWLVNLWNTRS